MSQSAPGWYQDHDDPSLARWWDGDRWTEHTLVLDEQDWSTEPDPPQTRFPDETALVPPVEDPSAGYEADIYAPIRDPWGDDPAPAGSSWEGEGDRDPDATSAWGAAGAAGVVGAGAAWTSGSTTTWDEEVDPRPRPAGLPSWAKVAIPLAVLAVVALAFLLFASGDDDDPEVTAGSSTTTTQQATLGEAADIALEAAGSGPFTRSTFTTLIPIACAAAESGDPTTLVSRIQLLGYDATALGNLFDGLEAGAEAYCPDDMEEGGDVLDEARAAVLSGSTTSSSTSVVTVPDDGTDGTTATTRRPTTPTTRRPTTTTRPPTTTPPPTTTTTAPTTTVTEPTTTTTTFEPEA